MNVPLDFEVAAHSYVTNQKPAIYQVSELYTDNYADIRDSLSGKWQYAFIQDIGKYVVKDSSGTPLTVSEVTVEETTFYNVILTVTPKKETVAAVGTPVDTTEFSKKASITIFQQNNGNLNGIDLDFAKSLSYDPDTEQYALSLSVKADTSCHNIQPIKMTYDKSGADQNKLRAVVPASGYYLFQLWGANGGKGQDYSNFLGILAGTGGAGGPGRQLTAYVHLEKGQVIEAEIGKNAEDRQGSNSSLGAGSRLGGMGGASTFVTVGEDKKALLSAGGGGGGGAAGVNTDGDPATRTEASVSNEAGDFKKAGTDGNASGDWGSKGAGGDAGVNYENPAFTIYHDKNAATSEGESVLSVTGKQKFDAATDQNNSENTHDTAAFGGGALYITCLQSDEVPAGIETEEEVLQALTDYTMDTEISRYFTVIGNGISGENFKDTNDKLEYGTPVITQHEDGTTHVKIPEIKPHIKTKEESISTGEGNPEDLVFHGEISFTCTIALAVREGFLGGNDVPVLEYDRPGNATGMLLSQTIPGQDPGAFQIPKQQHENPNNKSDYANVPIRYDMSEALEHLETHDRIYIPGDPAVPHRQLFTYDISAVQQYDWRDDYVTFMDPNRVDKSYAPTERITVPVEVGIGPVTEEPVLASVGEQAVRDIRHKEAVIEVYYKVTYDIGDLETTAEPDESGRYLAEPDTLYTATLLTTDGVIRPGTITVEVDGHTLKESEYTYDARSGVFSIPADKVTGNILIHAVPAVQETYRIIYVYEDAPGKEHTPWREVTYSVNDPISEEDKNCTWEGAPADDQPGYTFVWDWGDEAGITNMPKKDLYVTGKYIPNDYQLTIHYYKENAEESLAEDKAVELPYGSEYHYQSPVIPGYRTEDLVVSGKMDRPEDRVVDVYYTPTDNQLTIYYILKDQDGAEEIRTDLTFSRTYETDQEYHEKSPEIPGYTLMDPEQKTVSGTMPAEGKTVSVYYIPNTYQITFDADGGNCNEKIREVTFNRYYTDRFHEGAYKTKALPEPVRTGYQFLGWFDKNGEQVTDETKVTKAEDHTLTAKWEGQEFSLTVYYLDGNTADQMQPAKTQKVKCGENYKVEPVKIDGYYTEPAYFEGTMAAQNTNVKFRYYKNAYTLTIHHIEKETGNTLYDPAEYAFRYGETYEIRVEIIDGYIATPGIITGVMPAKDHEVTVFYTKEPEDIVNVEITWGDLSFKADYDGWNPLTHSYKSTKSIDPNTVNGNKVMVTSRSNVDVRTTFSISIEFEYQDYYESYLTEENRKDGMQADSEYTLEKSDNTGNSSKTLWLWLKTPENGTGGIPAGMDADTGLDVGTCTVTFSAVDEEPPPDTSEQEKQQTELSVAAVPKKEKKGE